MAKKRQSQKVVLAKAWLVATLGMLMILGPVCLVAFNAWNRQEQQNSRELLKQLMAPGPALSKVPAPKEQRKEIVKINTGDVFLGRFLTADQPPPVWLSDSNLTPSSSGVMVDQLIKPTFAEILKSYPVEGLRLQFQNAWNDPAVERRFIFWGPWKEWQAAKREIPMAITRRSQTDPQKPAIEFVTQRLRSQAFEFASIAEPAQARVAFEDYLLSLFMHEYYHATRQNVWQLEEQNLAQQHYLEAEVDCWAYTCKYVIVPMQNAGRGQLISVAMYEEILPLYHQLNGDTSNPLWRDTIIRVHSANLPR